MDKDADRYLETLPFWESLTDRERELVKKNAQIRSYDAGSVIHSHDHECLGMIRVISGSARTFMLSPEGREITLYRLEAGDVDILSASCVVSQIRFETQLTADADCTLLIIPASYFSELKEKDLAVRCFIYERLGERFSDVMQVMQEILFTPVESRIAEFIIENSSEQEDAADAATVRATHEQIAREINSSREVVSRIAKRFESEGLISLRRGRIEVLDRDGLEEYIF